ncbi:hypothetical protein PV04_08670 [Phialophora macrospora]|uniref:Uncharacterized protein n=1 Tax=Phialophora macrospora TaxID=1851006 RepID=A0A0D2DMY7_9EURO|nr:hypothetical protein PV04_08670 [Phialophora macrospora]
MSLPSVLEYARAHGLALDRNAEDLLRSLSCPLIVPEDEAELPEPDFSLFAQELLESRLQLSQKGGTLLAESIRDPCAVIDWSHFLPELHRVRTLKIEEPVLVGDHQTDVLRFRREASSHRNADQLLETCSLISTASEQGVEEEWDDIQSGKAARKVESELEEERCHTTKEALVHLSCLLKTNLTEESKDEILRGLFPSFQKPRARSITPVLMQEEDSPVPYIPSSPNLNFPLRSDEEVDVDNLLLQIESEMQERDQIHSDRASNLSPEKFTATKQLLQAAQTRPDVDLGTDLCAETIFPSFAAGRQPRERLKTLDFDLPMLSSSSFFDPNSDDTADTSKPHTTDSSPSQPERAFHPDHILAPPPCDVPDNETPVRLSLTNGEVERSHSTSLDENFPYTVLGAEDDELADVLDEDFPEELFRQGESARHDASATLEDDKITPRGGCWKYPVPQLAEVSISAPWENQQDDFLVCELDGMSVIPTDQAGRQKEERLNWQAIPLHLMKLGLKDEVEDNGKLHKWLEPPRTVTKSEQLIFKRPGLRLFDTDDDSVGEAEEDIDLLTEMRKLPPATVPAKRLEHESDSKFNLSVKKACTPRIDDLHERLRSKNGLATSLGGFSTSSALDTFLDLRGGRFKRVAAPQPPAGNELELVEDPIQQTQSEENDYVNTQIVSTSEPLDARIHSTAATIKVPPDLNQEILHGAGEEQAQLTRLEWCRTVVVETAILQRHGSLVNFLETHGNDRLNILYRDMSKIGRDNCVLASPDMILNARTALIFTNLQALSQKSLPGQSTSGQNIVRSRVLKLAQEYDRVLVVITTPSSNGALLQAQVDAMTTFTGFCASVGSQDGTAVTPIWVTSRGDPRTTGEALNKRAWSLICRYAFPEADPSLSAQLVVNAVTLTNEESLWEQFLRRAGLNTMAAQIVLGTLRGLGVSGGNPGQDWGLRKLVWMLPEERRAAFTETLGSKMSERLNLVLDREWR